ncbi:MAG: hypothetical protein M0Z84_14700 [Gammaproteobacteria bacterium]|nr:hypothetical protein [Gammaproteobacteria bacterium]
MSASLTMSIERRRTMRIIPAHRFSQNWRRGLLIGLFALSVSGCAYVSTYNPGYLPNDQGSAQAGLPGKGLVYTAKADDLRLYTGSPTSFTGGATKLTIPLGAITKEIAISVFRGVFRDGVDSANNLGDLNRYDAVVSPKIIKFTYEYNQAKNLGFAITPTVQLSLEVQLLNKEGKTYWEKSYNSGVREGPAYMVSGSPGERISELTHKTIYALMTQAATDIRAVIVARSEK